MKYCSSLLSEANFMLLLSVDVISVSRYPWCYECQNKQWTGINSLPHLWLDHTLVLVISLLCWLHRLHCSQNERSKIGNCLFCCSCEWNTGRWMMVVLLPLKRCQAHWMLLSTVRQASSTASLPNSSTACLAVLCSGQPLMVPYKRQKGKKHLPKLTAFSWLSFIFCIFVI